MSRDRRIRSLMANRVIDEPDTHCQTHGVQFDENRRCSACRAAFVSALVCASCGWRGDSVGQATSHEHNRHDGAQTCWWQRVAVPEVWRSEP